MSTKMPAVFIGHGSPMNAIEDNQYTRKWMEIAEIIPKPKAILSVSSHWYTNGTRITDAAKPKVVYDMYGFPEELYKVVYQPDGSPELAHETKRLIESDVKIDNSWGIDHGTWSVLCRMYPKMDIPVFQLSVDADADVETHFRIGEQLTSLREKGVMILGSGNIVHNLSMTNWNMDFGYPWANEFDSYIKDKIITRQYAGVLDYNKAGRAADQAFLTPEHFNPLLYVLGASTTDDRLTVFNDSCTLGSISMTCYLFTQ
jgi:4,5-DOPA dioxygenase extradiol